MPTEDDLERAVEMHVDVYRQHLRRMLTLPASRLTTRRVYPVDHQISSYLINDVQEHILALTQALAALLLTPEEAKDPAWVTSMREDILDHRGEFVEALKKMPYRTNTHIGYILPMVQMSPFALIEADRVFWQICGDFETLRKIYQTAYEGEEKEGESRRDIQQDLWVAELVARDVPLSAAEALCKKGEVGVMCTQLSMDHLMKRGPFAEGAQGGEDDD